MKTSSRVIPIPSMSSVRMRRTADEGQALAVLLCARGLANEHQVGIGVARTEDNPVARLGQRAAFADRSLVVDLDQCLAASLGAHESLRPRWPPLRGALSREALLRATPIRAPLVLHSAALGWGHLTRTGA